MLNFLSKDPYRNLTREQKNFFNELVLMDDEGEESKKTFLELVANQLVNQFDVEQAANFVGFFLKERLKSVSPGKGGVFPDKDFQKRYDNVRNLETLLSRSNNAFAFTYYLVKAIINKAKYPIGENNDNIIFIFKEITTGNTTTRTSAQKNFSSLINEVPKSILKLFSLCYQSYIEPFLNVTDREKEVAKSQFRRAFFEPFFYKELQIRENREGRRMSQEEKKGYVYNISKNDSNFELFLSFTEKLDEVNNNFIPVAFNVVWVSTLQDIYKTNQELFKLQAQFRAFSDFFQKMALNYNGRSQSKVKEHFLKLSDILKQEEEQKLSSNLAQVSSLDEAKALLADNKNFLNKIINEIVNGPIPDDLSSLTNLVIKLQPLQNRIQDLIAMFTQCATNFPENSPARLSYERVLEELNTLQDNVVQNLVQNVFFNNDEIDKEILSLNERIKTIIQMLIHDPQLSPLHWILMQHVKSDEQRQKMRSDITILLREGADPHSKITNYKLDGPLARIGKWMSSFTSQKDEPLSAIELSARWGNSELLNEARKIFDSEEKLLVLEKLSQTGATLVASEEAEVLQPEMMTVAWQKGMLKRERQYSGSSSTETTLREGAKPESKKAKT